MARSVITGPDSLAWIVRREMDRAAICAGRGDRIGCAAHITLAEDAARVRYRASVSQVSEDKIQGAGNMFLGGRGAGVLR